MKLTLVRLASQDFGTTGRLYVEGTDVSFDTLELPWRNNLKGKSCIMEGLYECKVWTSPTFHRDVIRLEDKNGRSDVLIHPANFAGDKAKGYETQIHGCIAVGHNYGQIVKTSGKGTQFGIMNSKAAMNKLMDLIPPNQPIFLEIKWVEIKT